MTAEPPPPDEQAPAAEPAKRTRLLVIAAGAVVVVALAAVLVVKATADDKPTDPHGIAERVAAVMANDKPGDLGPYYCADKAPNQRAEDAIYDAGDYRLGTETHLSDDITFFQLIGATNSDARYSLFVQKQGGNWCVAALSMCSRAADGSYLVTSPLYCHQAFPDVPLY